MSLGIIYRLISIQRLEGKRFTNKRNSNERLIRRTQAHPKPFPATCAKASAAARGKGLNKSGTEKSG
jgi:hypothetical protein